MLTERVEKLRLHHHYVDVTTKECCDTISHSISSTKQPLPLASHCRYRELRVQRRRAEIRREETEKWILREVLREEATRKRKQIIRERSQRCQEASLMRMRAVHKRKQEVGNRQELLLQKILAHAEGKVHKAGAAATELKALVKLMRLWMHVEEIMQRGSCTDFFVEHEEQVEDEDQMEDQEWDVLDTSAEAHLQYLEEEELPLLNECTWDYLKDELMPLITNQPGHATTPTADPMDQIVKKQPNEWTVDLGTACEDSWILL